jgi:hypothetical protein
MTVDDVQVATSQGETSNVQRPTYVLRSPVYDELRSDTDDTTSAYDIDDFEWFADLAEQFEDTSDM